MGMAPVYFGPVHVVDFTSPADLFVCRTVPNASPSTKSFHHVHRQCLRLFQCQLSSQHQGPNGNHSPSVGRESTPYVTYPPTTWHCFDWRFVVIFWTWSYQRRFASLYPGCFWPRSPGLRDSSIEESRATGTSYINRISNDYYIKRRNSEERFTRVSTISCHELLINSSDKSDSKAPLRSSVADSTKFGCTVLKG